MEFLANRSVSPTSIHNLIDGDYSLSGPYINLSEWQDERPPAPSYMRLLYLGKMLQDDETLSGELPLVPCSISILFSFFSSPPVLIHAADAATLAAFIPHFYASPLSQIA